MPDRILGRAERIDLPAFAMVNMPAKVDTGAYSSSIDCQAARVVKQGDQEVLEFVLLSPGREGYTDKKLHTTDFTQTEVTNSNGQERRFVIFTDMIVRGERTRCRFTLANRSKLRYPVLIGRRFIREANYLVDVAQGQGLPQDEEERDL